jgi:penicillin-binding protein 2
MATGVVFIPRDRDTKKSEQTPVKPPEVREHLLQRAAWFMLVITILMGGCAYRLVQLQLVHGEHNRQVAEANRIRLIPLRADRGTITDRKGQLLASSQLSRSVYFWPRHQSPQHWQTITKRLSPILEIPASEMLSRLETAGYDSPLPVRIAQQLDPTAFVALSEQAQHFPGVEIIAETSRNYPKGSLASHVLGYIGEADEADMAANPHYPNGMIVGKMGVERLANERLAGIWGNRLVEVDARGKEVQLLGTTPAESGSDVQLTLDAGMQQAAERSLGNRRGAVVALDVRTGAVLTLASTPTFDPNLFTRRITEAEWQRLHEGDQPFLNRALQTYPPGSTFKIVTAVAGMQSGHFNPNSVIGTSAYITVGNIQFWEHSRQGYGAIGFADALAFSSNTFFYQIGMRVGPEAIAQWGTALGIGNTSDMGLLGATPGMIPTPDQKETLFGEPWYTGDTVSTSIGQGLVSISPLEMAVMVAAIANGGSRVQPHLLVADTNTEATQPQPTGIDPGAIAVIQSGLVGAVQRGTAQSLNDGSVPPSAGKTGTAEVVGQPSHALFVGYAPANDPQIAVAVVVENGGFGGVAAVPIAKEVYKAYFTP